MNAGVPPPDSQRLKALADKTRVQILELLNHRQVSISELADGLGISQSLANYHVQVLIECGCADIAAPCKRDGQPTPFYTAKPGIVLSAPQLEPAGGTREPVSVGVLDSFAANARSALDTGDSAASTFAVETLTLTAPHQLTAHQALRLTLANLRALHEQSRQLNIATDAVLIPVEMGVAMFETPAP